MGKYDSDFLNYEKKILPSSLQLKTNKETYAFGQGRVVGTNFCLPAIKQ